MPKRRNSTPVCGAKSGTSQRIALMIRNPAPLQPVKTARRRHNLEFRGGIGFWATGTSLHHDIKMTSASRGRLLAVVATSATVLQGVRASARFQAGGLAREFFDARKVAGGEHVGRRKPGSPDTDDVREP